MLKTCTRCRSRRIRCDARLPACRNCHKFSVPCSFYDDVLQEDIPRSYIKGLYDRVDELKALLAAHQSQVEPQRIQNEPSSVEAINPFQLTIPSPMGQEQFLTSSPLAVIGNATIAQLLELGIRIEYPSVGLGTDGEDLPPETTKAQSDAVSPSTARLLLAHYARCIEPVYPLGVVFPDDMEVSTKHGNQDDIFRVLMACAISACHKSQHSRSWRTVAAACRCRAGELAPSVVKERNDTTVVMLIMLVIYELGDPERGLATELLAFASQICLELGWDRPDEVTKGLGENVGKEENNYNTFDRETRRRVLSVIVNIERSLSTLTPRPAILTNIVMTSQSHQDLVYNGYQHVFHSLYGTVQRPASPNWCPLSDQLPNILRTLKSMPAEDPMAHESWLLLHPFLVAHRPCSGCIELPDEGNPIEPSGIHQRVLHEACCLIDSCYKMMTSHEIFLSPMIVTTRTFISACVLVMALKGRWPSAEKRMGSLLKCSEIMAFTAPLWKGGACYYQIYRQISHVVY